MENYSIQIKKSAAKELRKLPFKDLPYIVRKIQALAYDPRPVGSKKLSGQNRYRVRYGDYRILYTIEDQLLVVVIVKVGHRKQVYR